MRNLIFPLAALALAIAPVAAAQTAPAPRDTEADGEARDQTAPEVQPAEDEDGGTQEDADALQSGGSAGSSSSAPRRSSLQQALQACEGLSGSASARCQEQALADHPGEY